MALFHPDNHRRDARTQRIYAISEVIGTAMDFLAATLFLVGSIMLFDERWSTVSAWLFVIGSGFFALRPTVKLVRELLYLRQGDFEDVTKG
ncbi:MAG: YrhK family protein [Pseudomonadota bacterium]